jgi:hypothetical protein
MFKFMKRLAFKKDFERAAADGVLTAEERRQLEEHGVDQDYANKVRIDHFLKKTAALRKRIDETRRMSPAEEEELRAIADGLKIDPQFGTDFLMARELWASDNGDHVHFDTMATTFALDEDETCLFHRPSTWKRRLEGRVKTKATGHLAITNRRLIHTGEEEGPLSVALDRIVDVEPFKDGIEVAKANGRKEFFQMDAVSCEYAMMLLGELLRMRVGQDGPA